MQSYPVRIVGSGTYLPGEPVKYDDIDKVLGELDQAPAEFRKWYKKTGKLMKSLLGMENYYYAIDRETGQCNETAASMAAKAGKQALEMAGMDPNEVDLLIFAGSSMDRFICPPTSVFVQEELGIKRCAELSIHSNCTATYKALQVASDILSTGRYKNALICSANLVSNALRAGFYNQAVIEKQQGILRWFLCDGAGAILLKRDDTVQPGLQVLDTYIESVGCGIPPHMFNRSGCSSPGPLIDYQLGNHHINQDFHEVSHLGVKLGLDAVVQFGEILRVRLGEDEFRERMGRITHVLANVPTRHMIDLSFDEFPPVLKRFGIDLKVDLYFTTVDKMGYCGPAAILLTIDKLLRQGNLADGSIITSFVTESSKWMHACFMLEWKK